MYSPWYLALTCAVLLTACTAIAKTQLDPGYPDLPKSRRADVILRILTLLIVLWLLGLVTASVWAVVAVGWWGPLPIILLYLILAFVPSFIRSLAKGTPPTLWWTLLRLDSKKTSTRIKATRKLGGFNHPRALDALKRAIWDRDTPVRIHAAKEIVRFGAVSARPLLDRFIDSSSGVSDTERTALAEALAEIRELSAIEPILKQVALSTSELREKYLQILSRMLGRSLEPLSNILKRAETGDAYVWNPTIELASGSLVVFSCSGNEVYSGAAIAMAVFAARVPVTSQAREYIADLFKHRRSFVRASAAKTLESLGWQPSDVTERELWESAMTGSLTANELEEEFSGVRIDILGGARSLNTESNSISEMRRRIARILALSKQVDEGIPRTIDVLQQLFEYCDKNSQEIASRMTRTYTRVSTASSGGGSTVKHVYQVRKDIGRVDYHPNIPDEMADRLKEIEGFVGYIKRSVEVLHKKGVPQC